ncbi:MAG: N-acetylmuramoyl-L-alanine amidase [Paludibacteraceae bacterium]|nr:N-acetylmuramoyl-L-alanine amidase [Paludibacteraceae bacterium]
MKRILTFVLAIAFGTGLYAIDKQALADTLTHYVKSRAYVSDVTISHVRVRNSQVFVYTNRSLSQVSLSQNEVRDLRLLVSQMVLGNNQGKVTIYTDGYEIGELVTTRHRHRAKNARYTLPATTQWVTNTSRPYSAKQGLDGKHIALWGSHGQYYHQPTESWRWQRAKVWSTVEDLYTTSYTMPFLVPMLENAGAVVVQPRERDIQTHEEIVDNTQAMSNGQWTLGQGAGWATPERPLLEGENPFTFGSYATEATGNKVKGEMRYTPSLPEGEYAVYVSYKTLPNSTSKAQYTVVHKGQKTTFAVNQKMGGGTWVYLGTFAFDGDRANNYVSVAAVGNGKEVVTTDAVKFGGGMGSVARYKQPNSFENVPSSKELPEGDAVMIDSVELLANQANAVTSGLPRYIEAARYWMQYSGIPDSIYNYTDSKNDYVDDYASRGIWVNYLAGGSAANPNQPGLNVPLHASLAFHTDAGVRDEIVGTLLIYKDHDDEQCKNYPNGKSRVLNRDLADYMQTQIVEDMRAVYAPEWTRRQLDNSSYAEVRHPKVPAVLLELLSHQNMTDMKYGLDPRVRFTISRAMYKSFLRFIHEQYGTEYVVQPLPVNSMEMRMESGLSTPDTKSIKVTWAPTNDPLEATAKPTYYIVYTRQNDGDWDNGVRVTTNEYTFTPDKGTRYDIRVAAGNAGGLSFKSEVLSAYIAPEEKGQVLIINGFTRVSGPDWWQDSIYGGIRPASHAVPYGRGVNYIGEVYDFDSRNEWQTDDNCGWGMCHSDHMNHPTVGNTFDYPTMHGRVLAEMGYSYVSTSVVAVDSIADYDVVDVILGKQKTVIMGNDTSFHCMPANLQHALTHYLQHGGRLLLSGAHIASDMQGKEDATFTKNQLHYEFRCTHASRTGKIRIERQLPQGNHTFRTEPNDEQLHTENADGIYPAEGCIVVARFPEVNVAAAIAHDTSEAGGAKTLCWSFMLESAHDFDALYKESINWLMK